MLLEVDGLTKTFPRRGAGRAQVIRAVQDVSFGVAPGETLALVGETGCGKSTVARCVLRLVEPTSGRVMFEGVDVIAAGRRELRRLRRRMQIVFQDPYSSLDPRMSVGAILEEPMVVHRMGKRDERRRRAAQILDAVGIPPVLMARKPHAFSGGQRQRIAIARALMMDPAFLVLDEPVSALDVSIQAQVLNLLRTLQRDLKLAYLFIVHDLAVARYVSHRIAVLYRGKLVETASSEGLFRQPLHPYTVSLLSAVPVADPRGSRRAHRIVLRGEVGTGDEQGCPFRSRCPVGADREVCREQDPGLIEHSQGHRVACHFPGELTFAGIWTELARGATESSQ
jgi:oligopeptide/dipeptide ABC transporter ATP-binding protein